MVFDFICIFLDNRFYFLDNYAFSSVDLMQDLISIIDLLYDKNNTC